MLALAAAAAQLTACSTSAPAPGSDIGPRTSLGSAATSSSSPGSTSSVTSGVTSGVTSSVTSGVSPSAPGSTTSTRATATISAGAYPAAEVCTYLSGQLPALTGVGSAVGAHANLVGNLFGFLQAHGIVPDSAALDEATSAHCPEVRQQVLAATGLTSLTQL